MKANDLAFDVTQMKGQSARSDLFRTVVVHNELSQGGCLFKLLSFTAATM